MAEQYKSRLAAFDFKNDKFTVIFHDGSHRDVKDFARRLVKVLQSQLRPDLGRAKLKTEQFRPRINILNRHP